MTTPDDQWPPYLAAQEAAAQLEAHIEVQAGQLTSLADILSAAAAAIDDQTISGLGPGGSPLSLREFLMDKARVLRDIDPFPPPLRRCPPIFVACGVIERGPQFNPIVLRPDE